MREHYRNKRGFAMADNTHIEWTDATWNPVTGCSLVSEGCRHCYAARLAATRLKDHPSRAGLARLNAAGEAKFTGEVRFNADWLDQPLRWRKPRRIFVAAHGDLFHEAVPDEWIDRVFAVMALCPQHTFQVLTKRPERMREYLNWPQRPYRIASTALDIGRHLPDGHPGWAADRWKPSPIRDCTAPATWPLPHVWLGTSVEDQETADTRIPHLLATPAAVRFLSVEPLLGPVDLNNIHSSQGEYIDALWCEETSEDDPLFGGATIDWVIVGGESGPAARPMHPDWARSLRDQCAAADVPFFFKQWGAHAPASAIAPGEHLPQDADIMLPAAKSRAGRLLDGVEHNGMPEVTR
jgi:protein gp37